MLDLIHFRYGEALFVAGQFDRAAKEYMEATLVTSAEPGLVTLSRLRAAQSLDLAGKRTEALEHYKAVLARPDVYDSHAEAKRGLREPYRKSGANNTTGETNRRGKKAVQEMTNNGLHMKDGAGQTRPRRLLLCLDGVPYEVIEAARGADYSSASARRAACCRPSRR